MTEIVIFADLHSSHELRQLDDSLYDSCYSLPPLVAGAGRGGGARLGHTPHLASAVPVGLDGPGEGAVGGNVLIYFLGCYTHQ